MTITRLNNGAVSKGWSKNFGVSSTGIKAVGAWTAVHHGANVYDLHMTVSIQANTSPSNSVWYGMTIQPILTALGKTSTPGVPSYQTRASVQLEGTAFNSTTYNRGMYAKVASDKTISIGRWYTDEGPDGGWPTSQQAWTVGTVYQIDIWGIELN